MSNYSVALSKKAQKQLDKLSDSVAQTIFEGIISLETNPRPAGSKKLKDRDGYHIWIRDYRVIYEILDGELLIHVIVLGHRKDIYD